MRKIKVVSTILLLVLCPVLLSGCAKPEEKPDYAVLKMAAWAEMPELMLLIADYNATHTDSQIELTTFYDMNVANLEAAMMRVRTELVTSREFDLYVLDGLNTMGLTNAGVLADLYTYMDNDTNFKRETYYMNLWSLFEKNGCLYEFVPTFNIAGTYGAESVIGNRTGWTIDEFTTLADQYGGPRNLLVNNRSLVLGYMIQYGLFPYIDLENSTCDFTNEGFYQWLNFIGGFTTDSNYEAPLSCGWIYDFNQYYDLTVSTDDTIIVAGMPAEDAGGPVVMALNAYGISATTEHPELCWDFLMSLMEDETQERLTGFSMRRDRMEEQFRRATISNDNPDALFYGWTVGEEEAPYPCMAQESVDYFRNLLENINRCAFRNDDIYNIIIEEATAYFNETKDPISIETVAAQIQDRVLKCLQETAK